MEIKILGTGCANCKQLEESVRKAVEETGVQSEIIKITDIAEIMKYGVMSMPGLIINGKVAVSGRVPSENEIKSLLEKEK